MRINRINHSTMAFIGADIEKLSGKYSNPWFFAANPDVGIEMKAWYIGCQKNFSDTISYIPEDVIENEGCCDLSVADVCKGLITLVRHNKVDGSAVMSGTIVPESDSIVMYTLWILNKQEAEEHGGTQIMVRGVEIARKGSIHMVTSFGVDWFLKDDKYDARVMSSDLKKFIGKSDYIDFVDMSESHAMAYAAFIMNMYLAGDLNLLDYVEIPDRCKKFPDGTKPPIENFTGWDICYVKAVCRDRKSSRSELYWKNIWKKVGLNSETDNNEQVAVNSEQLTVNSEQLTMNNEQTNKRTNVNNEKKEEQKQIEPAEEIDVLDLFEDLGNLSYVESSVKMDDDIVVPTYKTAIDDCNILKVEVGTTGPKGGDSGHGCRTYLRIEDAACTDIMVYKVENYGMGGVEIVLGGDAELYTFRRALKYAYDVLMDNCPNPMRKAKAVQFCTYWCFTDGKEGQSLYEERVNAVKNVFKPYSPDDKNYKVLYKEFYDKNVEDYEQPKFIGRANVMYNNKGVLEYVPVYCVIRGNGFTYFLSNNYEVLQQFRYEK